jgi:hypothetical protein
MKLPKWLKTMDNDAESIEYNTINIDYNIRFKDALITTENINSTTISNKDESSIFSESDKGE